MKNDTESYDQAEANLFRKCTWLGFWATLIIFMGIGFGQYLQTLPLPWNDYQKLFESVSLLVGFGIAWFLLFVTNKIFLYFGLKQVRFEDMKTLDTSSFATFIVYFLEQVLLQGYLCLSVFIFMNSLVNFASKMF